MKRGEETIIPNWALDAEETLTLIADAKVFKRLVRFRQYRDNTYSTAQLAYALEIDPRTIRASLERLHQKGLVLSFEGRHCSPEAASKLAPSQVKANASAAQAACKAAAKGLQKDPAQNPENTVPDGADSSLNKGRKELKEERNVCMGKGGVLESDQPQQASQPQGDGQAPDQVAERPTGGTDTQPFLEKTDLAAGYVTETGRGLEKVPAAVGAANVRPEHHGDDHDAVVFFHALAGYGFVSRYRNDLARWHGDYTPEFLRLAYRLSQTLPGAKGQWTFADVLNRDPRREWPEALKAQYAADVQATLKPTEGSRPRVAVGDLVRFADGETAQVIRVDSSTVVTDAEADSRAYVAFALLGKGVEVLRS